MYVAATCLLVLYVTIQNSLRCCEFAHTLCSNQWPPLAHLCFYYLFLRMCVFPTSTCTCVYLLPLLAQVCMYQLYLCLCVLTIFSCTCVSLPPLLIHVYFTTSGCIIVAFLPLLVQVCISYLYLHMFVFLLPLFVHVCFVLHYFVAKFAFWVRGNKLLCSSCGVA